MSKIGATKRQFWMVRMIRNHSIFGVLHFSGPAHLVAPCANHALTSLLNAAPNFIEALLGTDPVQSPLRMYLQIMAIKKSIGTCLSENEILNRMEWGTVANFETMTHDKNGVWVALVPQELSTNTSFQMQPQTKLITEDPICNFNYRDASSLKFPGYAL